MSASDDGRKVHIIPIGDAVAHEDRWGECACNPTLGTFETDDHMTGWVYIHRAVLTGGKR